MKNSEMPAMPTPKGLLDVLEHQCVTESLGLTKREMFAMYALQNIIGRYNPYESGDLDSSDYEVTAKHSVGLADALLAELDKE